MTPSRARLTPGKGVAVFRSLAFLLLAGLVAVAPSTASAQKPRTKPTAAPRVRNTRQAWSLTLFRSTYSNPFLREPGAAGGGSEVKTGQSVGTTSGRLGWMLMLRERAGIELGVNYLRVPLRDFQYNAAFGGSDTIGYGGASVTLVQGDIVLLGAPWRGTPLYVTGILGMGLARKAFTTTGNVFADWDGPRTLSEFGYSFGLGFRYSPIRQLSVVGEYRWVPGDQTTSIPMGGCYIYYRSERGPGGLSSSLAGQRAASRIPDCKSRTDNGHIASIGVAIAVP